jgi:putative addiction module killer protein
MITISGIKTIRRTRTFGLWLDSLRDGATRAIIVQRIERLGRGLGDVKSVGEGISELRIDIGPGWRVYHIEVAGQIILLLGGGNKSSQQADIAAAKATVRAIKQTASSNSPASPAAPKPRRK